MPACFSIHHFLRTHQTPSAPPKEMPPPTVKTVEISRASSHSLPFTVKKGDVIRWRFTVNDGFDVGLSILQPSGVEIQPSIRVTSDAGSILADADGVLKVTLDNGFSLLRGKTVQIRIAQGPLSPLTIEAAKEDGILDSESMSALVMKGLDLFFSNAFDEAERFFAAFADTVPIFSLSLGAVSFMRAIMSWDQEQLANAQEKLKATISLCSSILPQASLLGSVASGALSIFGGGGGGAGGSGSGGAAVTPAQLDATVISGEATLLSAILHLTDESLLGIVRFAMAVRGGYKYLVQADKLLGEMVSSIKPGKALEIGDLPPIGSMAADSSNEAIYGYQPCPSFPRLNKHTMGGVLFGLGTFACVASVLPPIAVRLIAAFGFPCDRDSGMQQLRVALGLWGVRSPLSALFILVMRALFPSFSSTDMSEHFPEAEAVLEVIFRRYPDSAFFSWLSGRLSRAQGDLARARERLERCGRVGLKQFAQLGQYEAGWSFAFTHDWQQTENVFRTLRFENNWSPAFYAYLEGAALIQQGRIAEGRDALKKAIKLSGRKLGGKVISAEQFALKRAAEFVALTYCDAPAKTVRADDPVMGPDETVLQASVLASVPKMRLPAAVARGSEAHAAMLGYAVPLIGLECIYLFNGATQMDKAACRSGIAQCDAVLKALAKGQVFDSAAPVWQEAKGAKSGQSPLAWVDRHKPVTASAAASSAAGGAGSASAAGGDDDAAVSSILPDGVSAAEGEGEAMVRKAAALEDEAVALSEAQITAMLEAAANVAVKSLASPGAAEAAAAATKAWSVASPANTASPIAGAGAGSNNNAASSGGGGGRLSIRGFMSSVASVVKSSPRGDDAGSSSPAVSSPSLANLTTAAPVALPPYAVPTQLQPVHSAAVAALVRGALCSRIGLVDAASACFLWVVETVGAAKLKQHGDLHIFAYAAYEQSVLYVDAVKAIARRNKTGGAAPPPSSHCGVDILSAALYKGMTVKSLAVQAKKYMALARDVKEDFCWKLRLHLRVHLTADDLRVASGKKGKGKKILGGAAAVSSSAAASGGASAGGSGASSGGGGADGADAAAAFEADLLKRAEGPLGADSIGEDDDEEDDEDGGEDGKA